MSEVTHNYTVLNPDGEVCDTKGVDTREYVPVSFEHLDAAVKFAEGLALEAPGKPFKVCQTIAVVTREVGEVVIETLSGGDA